MLQGLKNIWVSMKYGFLFRMAETNAKLINYYVGPTVEGPKAVPLYQYDPLVNLVSDNHPSACYCIWPTRRHGIVVNQQLLNLGEDYVKAMCAHEFGHFAEGHLFTQHRYQILNNLDAEMEADLYAVQAGYGEEMLSILYHFQEHIPLNPVNPSLRSDIIQRIANLELAVERQALYSH